MGTFEIATCTAQHGQPTVQASKDSGCPATQCMTCGAVSVIVKDLDDVLQQQKK